MSRNGKNSASILQEEIRRQAGSVPTTRFIRSLPAFRIDQEMPELFSSLLAELDRAEADQRNAGLKWDGG